MLKKSKDVLDPQSWCGLNRPDKKETEVDAVIFGIPFDGGVSYRGGAAQAPEVLRANTKHSTPSTERLYYYDSFENVEELTPRTIGGVELAGRTYKNVGMWWTEYYGEMPTGGWLAIKISGVDIDPGTEGDTVLNSITFG